MLRKSLPFLLLVSSVLQCATATSTISVKGAKFFADGKQFFLKGTLDSPFALFTNLSGVAYQGTPSDPLTNNQQCNLDASFMETIGINSIRVYHADAQADHDGCMKAFGDAGIYVWLDLETFNNSIVQNSPAWTESQLLDYSKVLDTFQRYDNIGGFFIGNEVINSRDGSAAAPFIKAAATDVKAYMVAKGYRKFPVGYASADIAELRPMVQNYLACGDQSIDFFGLNSYEWCGESSYDRSGYHNLENMAKDYPIPIFMSETGCNVPEPRTFVDQAAIFGPEMSETWSGSIIYEWVQESNHYGLVTYPGGKIYNGAPIPVQPDFDNLSKAWENVSPSQITEGSYQPSLTPPPCPEPTLGWTVHGDVPIPTLDPEVVQSLAGWSKHIPRSSPMHNNSPPQRSMVVGFSKRTSEVTPILARETELPVSDFELQSDDSQGAPLISMKEVNGSAVTTTQSLSILTTSTPEHQWTTTLSNSAYGTMMIGLNPIPVPTRPAHKSTSVRVSVSTLNGFAAFLLWVFLT